MHPLTTCLIGRPKLPFPAAQELPANAARNGRTLERNFRDLYTLRNIDKVTQNRLLYKIYDGNCATWTATTTPDLFIVDPAAQHFGNFQEVVTQAQRLVIGYTLSEGGGSTVDAYQTALQALLAGSITELVREAQRFRGPYDPCGDHGTLCLMLPNDWESLYYTSDDNLGKSSRVYFFKLDQHGAITAQPSRMCTVREALDYAHSYLRGQPPFQ